MVNASLSKKGIDFNKIFSPIIKVRTIHLVLGIETSWDLELEQLDVKITFLHDDIEEDLYMEQPEGFVK